MTLTRLVAATFSILALAGCGTTPSSPPAEGTPPAEVTTASGAKPATEATRPAGDDGSKSAPVSDKTEVAVAEPGAVATSATVPVKDASESTPPLVTATATATATGRLTDQEVTALLESIEKKRAAFEGALDDKVKGSTIKTERGEVNANEFFDDLQDQVQRVRDRFSSNYSASSEVLSLLQFAARLDTWASRQPAGFRGSKEWGALATDFRRLSAAYNSGQLRPGQQALGAQARRVNDAELVTVAANVDKRMDAFRSAYDSALAANTNLPPASRQTAIQNVDAMKNSARALNAALGKKQKGVAEADALLKGSAAMFDATLQLPPNSAAAAAWAPVREDLAKVALAYEALVAGPTTVPVKDATGSTPPRATAPGRLTDQEVTALLESIEKKRAAFEGALDDKLKNSTIKTERGEVNANKFFDDLQDQVQRVRDRFSSSYSASSEVLSLLQFGARLDAWASAQPAGFRGSKEWGALATDFRRLSAAYNSGLLRPGQQALGAQARRLNDAELMTAAANLNKNMDAFRTAYDNALAANTSLTPASRQSAIQNVDGMKNMARLLNTALAKKQKGVSEAELLVKGSAIMIDETLKLPPNSAAAAAWAPVREDLGKVALAYEVTPSR